MLRDSMGHMGHWYPLGDEMCSQLHGVEAVVSEEQGKAFQYAQIFELERAQSYPSIDDFERSMGFCIDRDRLESAARVLACPLKTNPPNWQHGRVIYSAASRYFETSDNLVTVLDIGTAKGFSALCLQWALTGSGKIGQVVSLDVIDPNGTDRRNTIAELSGPVTLAKILEPWPQAKLIAFMKSTGIDWLRRGSSRVHVAFVDGKHTGAVVAEETKLLASRQSAGDLVIFDDAQLPDVAAAIAKQTANYDLTPLAAKPGREYVIARRK